MIKKAFEIELFVPFQEEGYPGIQQKIEQTLDKVVFIDENGIKSYCHPLFEFNIEYI